jgi:hypothetical protein
VIGGGWKSKEEVGTNVVCMIVGIRDWRLGVRSEGLEVRG